MEIYFNHLITKQKSRACSLPFLTVKQKSHACSLPFFTVIRAILHLKRDCWIDEECNPRFSYLFIKIFNWIEIDVIKEFTVIYNN